MGLPSALKGHAYDVTGGQDVKRNSVGSRAALRLVQVFSGNTKVPQDGCQSTFGNILAAAIRNGCEGFVFGVPPDLVRTWGMANKLTA